MKIDIPENKIFKKNDTLEIGKINLLYGSNGVGKTMLSRAFALIDIETNLFTSEIKDDLKKNLIIKSENEASVKTIVFNSDYIGHHFNFKDSKANITFNLKNQHDDVTSSNTDLENLKTQKITNLKILKNFQTDYDLKKQKAEEITKAIIKELTQPSYPKIDGYRIGTGIKNKIQHLITTSYDTIAIDTYKKADQDLKDAKENKEVINEELRKRFQEIPIISAERYNELKIFLEETKKINNETEIDKYIQGLDSKKIEWLKTSVLYIDKNSDECPLCKQDLNLKDYILGYITYFDKIRINQIDELSKYKIDTINIININDAFNQLESKLLESSKKDCSNNKNSILEQIKHYNTQITEINKKIEEKQNNPTAILTIPLHEDIVGAVRRKIRGIEILIKQHDKKITKAVTNNENNIAIVLKHLLIEKKYKEIKNQLESTSKWASIDGVSHIDDVKTILNNNNEPAIATDNSIDYTKYTYQDTSEALNKIVLKIEENESSLEGKKDAAKDINNQLKLIWDYEKIKFKLNDEKNAYEIELNHNTDVIYSPSLSEGEKTSIAFAYFLVKLDALMNEDKKQNLLIYIDDPISSLDINITYQISEILIKLKKKLKEKSKDKLKEKFEDKLKEKFEDKLKEYTKTCLFVSTHNWYLFYLLNRHNPLSKEGNTYTIFKNIENKTVISKFGNFKKLSYFADYPIVFKEIYDFSERDTERLHSEEYDYFGMPNKARKIIETFMHFKYGKEDEKAIAIKDSFSPESHDHTANILPPETIQNNVKSLLNYIKEQDRSHYDAMIREETK